MNLDQLDNLPKLTIESKIWDMTWILNKTARLVERYNIEVAVRIKKSHSFIIDIIIFSIFPIAYEIQKRFADDLYDYVKGKQIQTKIEPKLTEPTYEGKQALPQKRKKVRYNKTINIKISWNKEWEEKGFEHDEEDDKLK